MTSSGPIAVSSIEAVPFAAPSPLLARVAAQFAAIAVELSRARRSSPRTVRRMPGADSREGSAPSVTLASSAARLGPKRHWCRSSTWSVRPGRFDLVGSARPFYSPRKWRPNSRVRLERVTPFGVGGRGRGHEADFAVCADRTSAHGPQRILPAIRAEGIVGIGGGIEFGHREVNDDRVDGHRGSRFCGGIHRGEWQEPCRESRPAARRGPAMPRVGFSVTRRVRHGVRRGRHALHA